MKRREFVVTFVVACILAVAGGAFAAQGIMAKQVAAPPSDIASGMVRLPRAGEIGIRSHSAMVPVRLAPDADGNWTWDGVLPVDSDEAVSLMLLSPEAAAWDAEVTEPGARPQRLEDLSWRGGVRHEQAWIGAEESAVPGELWRIERPRRGEWRLHIRAASSETGGLRPEGYVLLSSKSPYRVFSSLATYHLVPGEQVGLVTRVYDARTARREGAPEPLTGIVLSAQVSLRLPDGGSLSLPMVDDGLHADGAAGDGIFGALFEAEELGDYTAQVTVEGVTPEGAPLIRTTEHVFPVVAAPARLTGEASAEMRDGALALQIGADTDAEAGPVLVSAELWGTADDGSMRPVVWTGGVVTPAGSLDLRVDPRWLALAGVREPLELRNVTVRDRDTFVPVSTLDREEVVLHGELVVPKAAPSSITEEMLMGPRPRTAPVSSDKASGGKLLLVHGYCSGGVWPTSHFSNYAVFQDYHQNRTHDQFTRLIRDFGAQFPSFGIVAHSQGGCAALHLYTYYWSGLDYSSGSRLIQSVGTPYRGTSLAGNLALLGEIFGVGCGSNWDLTYDGASLWLSGIPSWARNRVYYATTSFEDKWWRYDYCNMASDLVLDDPDDGTTEKWAGQLSGGHNMGHKEGWCHTSNMRDPAQTTDYSRNYWMNIYANR